MWGDRILKKGDMSMNNISDWLSFLNERITSYESTQNTHLTFIGVILALAVAMIGINMTVKPTTNFFLAGQWMITFILIVVGIIAFFYWRNERNAPDLPYQQALRIRREIAMGTLTDTNDICQQCADSRLL